MEILGIVNITRDSFSDGGRYLEPVAAIAHARQLHAAGAAILDLGAQSTAPDAEEVPVAEEIARLTPVIRALHAAGLRVSVDAYKPEVIGAAVELGVEFINDVTALRDPASVAILRGSATRVILMHSVGAAARAERRDVPAADVLGRVTAFFDERIGALTDAGIARERLILDPGMGLFLGNDVAASLVILRQLRELRRWRLPLCISTTRKSFLGSILAEAGRPRPVAERGAGTLASELWAVQAGCEYVRTHDVRTLADGVRVWNAIVQPDALSG